MLNTTFEYPGSVSYTAAEYIYIHHQRRDYTSQQHVHTVNESHND